ncbi:hypothetical protein [Synechococcus sp. 1G10]|nr:hypothetical protein [Synechococcus sp. 1G10]
MTIQAGRILFEGDGDPGLLLELRRSGICNGLGRGTPIPASQP